MKKPMTTLKEHFLKAFFFSTLFKGSKLSLRNQKFYAIHSLIIIHLQFSLKVYTNLSKCLYFSFELNASNIKKMFHPTLRKTYQNKFKKTLRLKVELTKKV